MNTIETDLPEVLVFEPRVFGDSRGFFKELWNRDRYQQAGLTQSFLQDNMSRSAKGTLRGLHFQHPTMQGKLVSAIRGSIFDVAVDIRRDSPHFGKWVGVELSEENNRQIWVPRGFAHGFLVLSDSADVLYKVDNTYRPDEEYSLAFDDPDVRIDWPIEPIHLSAKDKDGTRLKDLTNLPHIGDVL